MNEVRVRMMPAEIGQRHEVARGTLRRAEPVLQYLLGIRPRHRMHGVEAHAEAALEHGADRVEVEQALHQFGIVADRIDHIDRHAAGLHRAHLVDVDRVEIGNLVFADLLRALEDRIGHFFRRRAAILGVVFDAEILVRAAGIVARRQYDAAEGAVLADDVRRSRRREDAALPDHDLAEAVRGGHADHGLHHLAIVKAPVAAEHQRLSVAPFQAVEDRLHEVLDIVLLLENRHLLAQAGGSRLLVLVGRGRNRPCHRHAAVLLATSER